MSPVDVRYWHLADNPSAPELSAFGQSGYRDRLRADIANGHERADVTRVT
jgi:hypothetical protein